ncbi:MAG: prolipoprotein diacylglyceryl transferase [bacterium]|nr:prolipoprotein diacylglyceryl transferase [bacterium]
MIEFLHTYIPSAVAFTLGPLTMWWYGIGYLVGISCAFALSAWIVRKKGMEADQLWDVAFWIVLAGLVGARVWYVIVIDLPYYLDHLIEIPQIWRGGMAIHGALVGGLIALWWWCRKKGEAVFQWTDVLVPGVVLGQIIGRFGNWANQELYGLPTMQPWGIPIDPAHRISGFEESSYFHPMFLYEALLNALLLAILIALSRRSKLRAGVVTFAYFVGYGIIRSLLDPFRIDPVLMIGPVRITTAVSMVITLLVFGYGGYAFFATKHFCKRT